jgi:hypothetical protein
MGLENIQPQNLKTVLALVKEEFEGKLEKTQDRLLTAVFGFVNGASARMEALENTDRQMRTELADMERRLEVLERRGRRRT